MTLTDYLMDIPEEHQTPKRLDTLSILKRGLDVALTFGLVALTAKLNQHGEYLFPLEIMALAGVYAVKGSDLLDKRIAAYHKIEDLEF